MEFEPKSRSNLKVVTGSSIHVSGLDRLYMPLNLIDGNYIVRLLFSFERNLSLKQLFCECDSFRTLKM